MKTYNFSLFFISNKGKAIGEAGETIVIEELLEGEEVSVCISIFRIYVEYTLCYLIYDPPKRLDLFWLLQPRA